MGPCAIDSIGTFNQIYKSQEFYRQAIINGKIHPVITGATLSRIKVIIY
jgi:hypothetical protein